MLKNAICTIALILGAACACASASAATTVLTFDYVYTNHGEISEYAGFHFSGFHFVGNDVQVGYGDEQSTGGGDAVELGGFGTGTAYTLEGLYLSSAYNDNNIVTFTGYRNTSMPLFMQNVVVNTGAPTLVGFDWRGVNFVAISSTNGNVVVDKIAMSPVPEPSSAAMVLSAAGLLGFLARRRKNAGAKA